MNGTLERSPYISQPEVTPASQLELATMRLDDARMAWAEVSAKNRDRMVRRRIEGYNDIRDEYNQATREYGQLSRAEAVEGANGDIAALSQIVADFTVEEHTKLRQESERFTDSKKIRKFARKFGEWMNSGNTLTKIGKGAAVAGAVAVTVAVSPIGAALGVGVALASKGGISYLRGANRESGIRDLGEGTLTTNELTDDRSLNNETDLFALMQQKASDTYKADNKEVQRKVSKATRRGLGLAAFTTVLGGTLGMAAHGAFMPSAQADSFHEPVGFKSYQPVTMTEHEPVGFSADHETVPMIDTPVTHEPVRMTPMHESGVRFETIPTHETTGLIPAEHEPVGFTGDDTPTHEAVPLLNDVPEHEPVEVVPSSHESVDFIDTDPTPTHESVGFVDTDGGSPEPSNHETTGFTDTPEANPTDDWSELSHEARFVEPGEGGWQTMKELGIPEHKWEVIWQDAGAKLNAEDKTYLMKDGRWGWSDSMRLSDNDLSILAKAASSHGVTL